MSILFGSVVYKKALPYLETFFRSIEQQDFQDYGVLLINDDLQDEELELILSKYSFETEVIHIRNRTPAQLRIDLLRNAKKRNTDLLILGDCDDSFCRVRINNIVKTYLQNPDNGFYYNELADEYGKILMPPLPERVCDFKIIGECNFLGMSNTALNMNRISLQLIDSLEEFPYEIFDWYLFSRLLLNGLFGEKVENCFTIYRIHENNLAGLQQMNELNVKREIEVKQKHYKILRKYDSYYEDLYHCYHDINPSNLKNIQENYYWWNLLKIS